jgi:hypothetical protein
MKALNVLAMLVFAGAAAAGEGGKTLSFDKAKLGELPGGWKAAQTGKGQASVWKVVEDKTAPGGPRVLAQTAEGPAQVFNLCVAEQTSYKDLDLTVAFKAVAGKTDQGGGPVWRYQDANNYYIARMNPLEENFRLYKIVEGKRLQLATKNVDSESGKWHTLRVVHRGNHIQCYLNGKLLLDAKDDTFAQAGKVGLWTKADAQTSFDDFTVSEAGK